MIAQLRRLIVNSTIQDAEPVLETEPGHHGLRALPANPKRGEIFGEHRTTTGANHGDTEMFSDHPLQLPLQNCRHLNPYRLLRNLHPRDHSWHPRVVGCVLSADGSLQ